MKGAHRWDTMLNIFAGKTREEQQKFFLNTGDSSKFARKLCCDYSAPVKKV